jgi:CDGSH-type Zn-finger protein
MTTIKIAKDGPLIVDGEAKLVDHEGREVKPTRQPFALCRCGGSVNKPFCDGTHSKIGFQGARKAVEESGQ